MKGRRTTEEEEVNQSTRSPSSRVLEAGSTDETVSVTAVEGGRTGSTKEAAAAAAVKGRRETAAAGRRETEVVNQSTRPPSSRVLEIGGCCSTRRTGCLDNFDGREGGGGGCAGADFPLSMANNSAMCTRSILVTSSFMTASHFSA